MSGLSSRYRFFLASEFGWDHWTVGGFLALWIIVYGMVQSIAPKITGSAEGKLSGHRAATQWAAWLSLCPILIASGLLAGLPAQTVLLSGLVVFGILFAVNSSLHSFLIVHYAEEDGVSLDVGFYYMANAMGRLIGTVLSGWVYQQWGLIACLWISAAFILLTVAISFYLPSEKSETARAA